MKQSIQTKLLAIAFIAFAITLFACSDDSDITNPDSDTTSLGMHHKSGKGLSSLTPNDTCPYGNIPGNCGQCTVCLNGTPGTCENYTACPNAGKPGTCANCTACPNGTKHGACGQCTACLNGTPGTCKNYTTCPNAGKPGTCANSTACPNGTKHGACGQCTACPNAGKPGTPGKNQGKGGKGHHGGR